MVLVGQFAAYQRGLFCVQKWQDHRHGFVPPGKAAQIGLLHFKVASHQVHACQHFAQRAAMRGARRQLAPALEAIDDGSRFAVQAVQHMALAVGSRVGHRYAVPGQVLHQPQVKRQLLRRQPLEQGQHIRRLVCGDKIIGVFNAAGAALHMLESA